MGELREIKQPDPDRCPICFNKPTRYIPGTFFPGYECPRCGNFDYERRAGRAEWRLPTSPAEMVRLSGWVREQNAAGLSPVRIYPESARRVMQMRLPGLRERSMRVLAVLARENPSPDAWFVPETVSHFLELQGVSFSRDANEILLLIRVLEYEGFLTGSRVTTAVTVKGLLAAEALGASGSSSPQGFVAMSFHDSMNDPWLSGFEPGIRAAGYQPRRVDTKDFVGGVSDEIMAEIRRSRFVVADYTGSGTASILKQVSRLGSG